MENAAKALLIAGGILLALMTLSLIVYMSTATTRMMEAQDEKKETEELAAFNSEYQSYNKSRMYGTDVITVVNKAINYNKKADVKEAITIKFSILEDFTTTTVTTETNARTGKTTKTKSIVNNKKTLKEANSPFTVSISTLNKVEDFFSSEIVDTTETMENSYTIKNVTTYSGLANFKRVIFECTRCEDTNNDGRIDIMEFQQINTQNDVDDIK